MNKDEKRIRELFGDDYPPEHILALIAILPKIEETLGSGKKYKIEIIDFLMFGKKVSVAGILPPDAGP